MGPASTWLASTSINARYVEVHTPSPPDSKPEPEREARSQAEGGITHLDPEKGSSPVRVTVLEVLLRGYPDQVTASYLLQGFKVGVFIPFQGPRVLVMSQSLTSIQGLEHVVRAKLDKKLQQRRILDPFEEPPVPNLRVSPLGVVPKKMPGDFRIIHHMSQPWGHSVNNDILEWLCTVKYTSFD